MKTYLKWGAALIMGGGLALCFYWGWYLRSSPQGRLDRILSSERTSFTLPEVFGNDWKILCFFPASYSYASSQNEGLLSWISTILERPLSGDEWRHVSVQDETKRIHLLTDIGPLKGALSSNQWQGNDANAYYVACTRHKKSLVNAVRDGDSWHLNYTFEYVWNLNR